MMMLQLVYINIILLMIISFNVNDVKGLNGGGMPKSLVVITYSYIYMIILI